MSPRTKKLKLPKPIAAVASVGPTSEPWPVETLEIKIRNRIENRLGPRIRNLRVEVANGRVIIGGDCSTYYSKQLAQHAALGVIEDEHLDNLIEVGVRR